MTLSEEGREAIQKSNRERNLRCGKCGAMSLKELDGSQCYGLPGIKYWVCDGCGWSRPITKRVRREKL